jgi:hypothetical protein
MDAGLLTRLDYAAYLGRELAAPTPASETASHTPKAPPPKQQSPKAEPNTCDQPGCDTNCA